MCASVRRLMLYCDALNSRFTLAREGEDGRQSFDTFEEAYEYAEARAIQKTPLILFDKFGRKTIETTVPSTEGSPALEQRAGSSAFAPEAEEKVASAARSWRTLLEDLGYVEGEGLECTRALALARRFNLRIVLDFITKMADHDAAWEITEDSISKAPKAFISSSRHRTGFDAKTPFLDKPIGLGQLLQLLEDQRVGKTRPATEPPRTAIGKPRPTER